MHRPDLLRNLEAIAHAPPPIRSTRIAAAAAPAAGASCARPRHMKATWFELNHAMRGIPQWSHSL